MGGKKNKVRKTSITESTQTSSPSPAKGAGPTFTYTKLPSTNDFGDKTLTLTHPKATSPDTETVQIFFTKTATNNPGGSNPNWYYYWNQTGASSGTHAYVNSSAEYGYYDFGDNHFHICNLAAGTNDTTGHNGIDCFAETCLHENQHKTDYFAWWPNGYNPAQDLDNDWVPDNIEPSLGFDPTKWDTDGDSQKDFEDRGYDAEKSWNAGSTDNQDWANPGHQSNI